MTMNFIENRQKIAKLLFRISQWLFIFGLLAIIFWRVDFFMSLFNRLRGHQITPAGFDKINRLYFYPFKLFPLGAAVYLFFMGLLLSSEKILNRLYGFLVLIFQKVLQFKKPLFFFLVVFLLNFFLHLAFAYPRLNSFQGNDASHYLMLAQNIKNGEGYQTEVAPLFFIRPEVLLADDFYRPPLYSYLIAGLSSTTGASVALTAIILNIFLISLIPILVYFLSQRIFQEKKVSFLAMGLMSVNLFFLRYPYQTLTEILYIFLILLFFILLLRKIGLWPSVGLGIIMGLAYLTRAQALFFLPLILIFSYWRKLKCCPKDEISLGKAAFSFLIVLVFMALVISPWLLRNYSLTGHPLASDYNYHLQQNIARAHMDWHEFSRQIENSLPSIKVYLLTHPFQVIIGWLANLKMIFFALPFKLLADPILFLLALFFIIKTRSSFQTQQIIILTYLILVIAAFSFLSITPRHVSELAPFLIIFSAAGFYRLYLETKPLSKKFIAAAVAFNVIFFIFFSSAAAYIKYPGDPRYFGDLVKFFQKDAVKEGNMLLSTQTFYNYSYYLNRPAIIFPATNDIDFLKGIVSQYNIRYLVLASNWHQPHIDLAKENYQSFIKIFDSGRYGYQVYEAF